MPTHQEIFASHAHEYEDLVSREDYQGNILKTIQEILPLAGLDVVDLGAGTGRLAFMLAPYVRSILSLDLSLDMLRVARAKLRGIMSPNPLVAASDHRWLPLCRGSADLIVSAWSVSYLAVWSTETWRREVETWLNEAHRILREKGVVILFESLGTGNETPLRVSHLENFYGWLDEKGFSNKWIRTDYCFESWELAAKLAGFFFGEVMKGNIRRGEIITLPECTGVWWRRL